MAGNSSTRLVVQAREWTLMRQLLTMRVVDRDQARAIAKFSSRTRVNSRLLALTRAGLLRRCFLPLNYGGSKALYTLSSKGAALVGTSIETEKGKLAPSLKSELFLEHQLAVNSIQIKVQYCDIPIAGASFRRWQTFQQPLSAAAPLIPDGYFEIKSMQGVRALFAEVDRGTEALRIWKEKIKSYLAFATSGDFTPQFGHSQFRVLVICDSERRLQSLRALVAESTEKIFWFSTFDSISRDGFWSAIWLRPKSDQKQSLL